MLSSYENPYFSVRYYRVPYKIRFCTLLCRLCDFVQKSYNV
nr:MAG TPA: hypothetical protein [Siphoviridae sp. ctEfY6]